jgi:hypothetical protein
MAKMAAAEKTMAAYLFALLSLNLVAQDLESFRRAASETQPGAACRQIENSSKQPIAAAAGRCGLDAAKVGASTRPTECSLRAARQQSAN